jgi:DNA-binding SARP family transcriptional activator/TolB-like protein
MRRRSIALLARSPIRSLGPSLLTGEALVVVIRIHALGGLSVRGGDGEPMAGAAGQPRRMALLAVLARAGQRGMSREKVLALLWPDSDDERASRAIGQAVYMLRRDLGSDDSIGGTKELRLDPAVVASDVADFASAVSRGDDETAAQLYGGPFLDGFHLSDADEFSRWVERERSLLAHDYARVLESLARTAAAKGDTSRSVGWWRRLAAIDPLNARVTVGLMEALASSGDRAGALQHARVYEALLGQELDLGPDHDVLALAARLRTQPAMEASPAPIAPATPTTNEPSESVSAVEAPPAAVTDPTPVSRDVRRRSPTRMRTVGSVVVAATAIIAVAMTWRSRSGIAAGDGQRIVVVGRITDYGAPSGEAVGRALGDMIGTNLARSPGLHVVSATRMYELIRQLGSGPQDTSLGVVMTAARHAGATEMIDGSVYALAAGRMRIDLHRIDVASGAVLHADQIEAENIFALADSSSLRIVKQLGAPAPRGSLADVTTRSAVAYRLYEDGLQEYFADEPEKAAAHFTAALVEDSTFAMAAYYQALALNSTGHSNVERLARAVRLSGKASDREALIIRTAWAGLNSSPSFRALAESLATRFPEEVEGHLFLGQSLLGAGEFLAAVPPLQRVVAMDSLEVQGTNTDCAACRALASIVSAYQLSDSLEAAERISRSWLARQPESLLALRLLGITLEYEGRSDEARVTIAKAAAGGHLANVELGEDDISLRIRSLDFSADQRLADRARSGLTDPLFWSVISLRAQGRLSEALVIANRLRATDATGSRGSGAPGYNATSAAQVLFDRAQFRAAAALFDSIAHGRVMSAESSAVGRNLAWFLTHSADALAAAGDTAGLPALADSIQAFGARSASARDQRLHHHVRGLLMAARGRPSDAVTEFRQAVYSLTSSFTRTNLELARALLSLKQPLAAIAVLRPALHGPIDASNLYVTHAELHEMLAHAWEMAGNADSAVAHYDYVARAWSKADAPLAARGDGARRKVDVHRRRADH